MKLLLMLGLLATITACGSSYRYKHTDITGATCEVTIKSNRDILGGKLRIGKDCNINSGLDDAHVNEKAYEAVNKTLDVLKMLAIP